MMTREQMMDTMIHKYGFEDEIVIEFCALAESNFPIDRLTVIFTIVTRR